MLQGYTIHWSPLLPPWSLALIGGGLLVLLVVGCLLLWRKRVPGRTIAVLAVMRGLAIVIFLLCLWQPIVSYERDVPKRPDMLVLVDTSASMNLPHSPDQTRLQQLLTGLQQSKLPGQIDDQFRTHWFTFDGQAHTLDEANLGGLKPQGPATNYARSLTSAMDLLTAQETSPDTAPHFERVLLVSDGQDHGQEDLIDVAQRLGVKVDVLPAAATPAANASQPAEISRVQSARRVLLGSETQFLVAIHPGQTTDKDLVLVLEEDGQEVQQQEFQLDPNQAEQRLVIAYRPTTVGLKHYDFSLRPKKAVNPSADAERYSLSVQVVDDKLEVLVLEDRWRWEFKYLRRVLEDDPSFNFSGFLARGGRAYVQFGEPDRRVNLAGFPQSRAELDWFDVIVLGDVHPSRWPAGLSSAIADAVIEGGKSLVLIAGPALHEVAQIPELNVLLPVELSAESASPLEGPVTLRITPEGAQSAFLSHLASGGSTSELPPVDQVYPPIRKRPAATVLVEAAEAANSSGPLIVMAEQTVGRGRVLYIGTDTLWKWQMLTSTDEHGQTPYARFWEQTLRALTPARTSGSTSLWLQADRSRYDVGSRATLRAELPIKDLHEHLTFEASIVLPDERRLPLSFAPDTVDSGVFVSQFDVTMPGSYRISLVAKADDQQAGEASLVVDALTDRTELDDTYVDLARLSRIAARTGGEVINLDEPQSWPTVSAEKLPIVHETRSANLLDNLVLIVMLCGVLGSDWLLRLLRGMV